MSCSIDFVQLKKHCTSPYVPIFNIAETVHILGDAIDGFGVAISDLAIVPIEDFAPPVSQSMSGFPEIATDRGRYRLQPFPGRLFCILTARVFIEFMEGFFGAVGRTDVGKLFSPLFEFVLLGGAQAVPARQQQETIIFEPQARAGIQLATYRLAGFLDRFVGHTQQMEAVCNDHPTG